MAPDNSRMTITESPSSSPERDEGRVKRLGRLQQPWSTLVPSRRTLAVGLLAVMVILAGCGGDSSNGTQTPTSGTDSGQPDGTAIATDDSVATGGGSGTPTQITTNSTPANMTEGETIRNASNGSANTSAAAAGPMTNSSPDEAGLNVIAEPRTANSSNVTLYIYSAMSSSSATDSIENITVNAGEGLDVSGVTVANVDTAGIDEGSNQSRSQTNGPSLGSNVEGRIKRAGDGEGFVVPLDGSRAIEQNDELVVVIDGGIATTEPGNYTFSLGINNASVQEDSYNITAA